MNSPALQVNTKLVLNLLGICEEMLFSIYLNPEIVKKYETMRESVFEKLSISTDFSKYWEFQSKALDQTNQKKALADQEKLSLKSSLETSTSQLSKTLSFFSEILNIFNSNSEEAGNMDTEDLCTIPITSDLSTYLTQLSTFKTYLTCWVNKHFLLQKQCSVQMDSLNALSCENSKLKTALETLQKSYSDSIENLENVYQTKIHQLSRSTLNESRKFNELEMSFQEKESKLIVQLDKLSTEDASVLKRLREKLERLQHKNQELRLILKAVSERSSIIFNEFIDKEEIIGNIMQRKQEISELHSSKTWSYYAEMLAEIDFIGYSLHKLQGDNDWLIEQLDVVCKENEELKARITQEPHKQKVNQVFQSLTSNDMIVKEFNAARQKLVSQFKEKKSEYN